jgi:outer membrane protein assembly factor BamB
VELAALDAAGGRALWQYPTGALAGAGEPCRPVVAGNGRVCWTSGAAVHLLEATSGKDLWSRPVAEEGVLSNPVVEAERVYVASASVLHCLDLGSGEELWRLALEGERSNRNGPLLAADQGKVYVAGRPAVGNGRLTCVDLAGRTVLWSHSVPRATHLLASADGLYLRGQDVLAYEPATGRLAWKCKAAGCGPVTCADGLVYFVDSGKSGSLVAVRGQAGELAWELRGLRSCDAFTKVGDTGYLKTQDGVVHAIALAACKVR